MARRFEELGFGETPIGEISLRRRVDPSLGEVYEVKLGDEWLMSSLFTVAEIELSRLALSRMQGAQLAVAVGGLGLGHTAFTALADPRVAELLVVEYLEPVIGWHRAGLVPGGAGLAADPRTRFVHGDFFALSAGRRLRSGRPRTAAGRRRPGHRPLAPPPARRRQCRLLRRRGHPLAGPAPASRRRLRALVQRPAGRCLPGRAACGLRRRRRRGGAVPEPVAGPRGDEHRLPGDGPEPAAGAAREVVRPR